MTHRLYHMMSLVFEPTVGSKVLVENVRYQLQRWQAQGLLTYEDFGEYDELSRDDQVVIEISMNQPGPISEEVQNFLDDIFAED